MKGFKEISIYGLFVLALMLQGCATVTITPKGQPKTSVPATYEDSKSFFLFGLVGEQTINVTQVCKSAPVRQMQTQRTFLDSFLTIITLGIYAPRTAKVWCAQGGKT